MSFFDTPLEYNTFSKIIDNTYEEFFHELSSDLTSYVDTSIDSINRAINECTLDKLLIKTTYSSQAENISKKYHPISSYNDLMNSGSIHNEDYMQIDKIEADLGLLDSLKLIKSIRENLGSGLYGVVLVAFDRNGRKKLSINPLNPVVSSVLKRILDENDHSFLKHKFHIIVYSLKKERQLVKNFMSSEGMGNEAEDIKDLIVASHLSPKITVVRENIRRRTRKQLAYDEIMKDERGRVLDGSEQPEYSIVPVQISNNSGMMYPYYGAVLLNRRNGKNMSPFLSANVGNTSGGEWSNICAGSLNSSTDSGKKTLNHSNSGSPLTSQNIKPGAYTYASKCIDICLAYLLDENINELAEEKKPERMSLAQYREEHPEAPISEYISYIRELNISELPNWE